MNEFTLLTIFRVLAAAIMGIILGHQAESTMTIFGMDGYSIGYLATLAIFYLALYLIRFFITIKNPGHWLRKNNIIHGIQLTLVIITLLMAIYASKVDLSTLSAKDDIKLLLRVFFILFPEIVFSLLETIYHYLTEDEDETK